MNTIEFNASNPKNTIEGSNSIIIDLIKCLTDTRDNDQIITSIEVKINTINNTEPSFEKVTIMIPDTSMKQSTAYSELIDFLERNLNSEFGIEFWFELSDYFHKAIGAPEDEPVVYALDEINEFLKENKSKYRIANKINYEIETQYGKLQTFWIIEL